jgi:transketolase
MSTPRTAIQVEYFGKALVELGNRHNDLVVLDADVSASTKTSYYEERFPRRFIQTGISEQDMIGIAAGLALSGKTAVAAAFANFLIGRGWEQIINSVARQRLNVKIVGTHAGLSPSSDGASHQALGDVALMRVIPNMTVVCPSDASQAGHAITDLVESYGPAYLRLRRGSTPVVYEDNADYTVGEAITIRDGSDATIICNGSMVAIALDAAGKLLNNGVDVRVIDMHTIKPLDRDSIIRAASETGAIVTAEEHNINGGLGSAVAECLSEEKPTIMKRVGVPDSFGSSSRNYPDLMKHLGLTSDGIIKAVNDVVKRRK